MSFSRLQVIKKASLVRSWNEDIVSDDILNDIATRAKTEKGRKIKVKVNEAGVRLTRSRFLQESQTTFFPIASVQTMTKSPEFSRCIMMILKDPKTKYKIVALRCETEADAEHLTNVFAEIQNKIQSTNIELKKRENGNWTLRGRSEHNAKLHMLETFKEHKEQNGDVIKSPEAATEHVPVLDARDVSHTNGGHLKVVYVNREEGGRKVEPVKKDDSDDENDDYVIETEVASYPYPPMKNQHELQVPEIKEVEHDFRRLSVNDKPDGDHSAIYAKPMKHPGHNILPSKPVIYAATTNTVTASQPELLRATSRTYDTVLTASPAGYYTNPWAQKRFSRDSSVIPRRIDGNRWNIKSDQQSIISNSSRFSKSHRMRTSEFSIPSTVQRSIEHTYGRPVLILRRGHESLVGFRPRPASYHPGITNELRLFRDPDDGTGLYM